MSLLLLISKEEINKKELLENKKNKRFLNIENYEEVDYNKLKDKIIKIEKNKLKINIEKLKQEYIEKINKAKEILNTIDLEKDNLPIFMKGVSKLLFNLENNLEIGIISGYNIEIYDPLYKFKRDEFLKYYYKEKINLDEYNIITLIEF